MSDGSKLLLGFVFIKLLFFGSLMLMTMDWERDVSLEIQQVEQLQADINNAGCPVTSAFVNAALEKNRTVAFKQDRNRGLLEFMISDQWDQVQLIEFPHCR